MNNTHSNKKSIIFGLSDARVSIIFMVIFPNLLASHQIYTNNVQIKIYKIMCLIKFIKILCITKIVKKSKLVVQNWMFYQLNDTIFLSSFILRYSMPQFY